MKIKLDLKTYFKLLFVSIIIVDFVALYYLYGFLNKNVMQTINYSGLSDVPSARISEDINISQFEEVISRIENKQKN